MAPTLDYVADIVSHHSHVQNHNQDFDRQVIVLNEEVKLLRKPHPHHPMLSDAHIKCCDCVFVVLNALGRMPALCSHSFPWLRASMSVPLAHLYFIATPGYVKHKGKASEKVSNQM